MLIKAIKIVRQSIIVSIPISKQILIIIAIEATFTASKKVENNFEFLIFFTKGFKRATKIKEGKNIAIVEMNAPENPLI